MGTLMKNGVAYGGGSGGTSDYDDLSNKPSIENITLSGNKSASDLGLVKDSDLANVAKTGSYNDLKNKPAIPSDLDDMSDVELTTPTDGQVLKYNSTSGKWENGTGGGGASAVSDLTDVDLDNIQNGQILKWNSTDEVWENANESGGGSSYTAGDGIDITNDVISTKQSEEGDIDEIIDVYPTAGELVSIVNAFNRGDIYSADEKMIGQWYNGKPLYQKIWVFSSVVSLPSNSWFNTSISGEDIEQTVKGYCFKESYKISFPVYAEVDSNVIKLLQTRNAEMGQVNGFILQYTKTTDSAISIGSETEYSTDEKVIGTWIDGKPLYQKTVEITTPNIADYQVINLNMTNVSKAFLLDSSFIQYNVDATATQMLPINSMSTTTLLIVNSLNELDCIMKVTDANWRNKPCFLTIQYIKSTT